MNFNQFPADRIRNLADIVVHQAKHQPDHVALSFAGKSTTYGELDRLSNRVAHGLVAGGIRPGSRVAILDKGSDVFFQICFGVAKARAALVPLNFRLAPPELHFVLQDCEAEILYVGNEFLETAQLLKQSLPSLKRIVSISDFPQWRDGFSQADTGIKQEGDDVCLQIYTSGTTGNPKGAQLTNDNMLSSLPRAIGVYGDLSERDVLLVAPPLFHVAGCGTGILGMLAGARNVIVRDFVPLDVLNTMKQEGVTVALFVPAMIQGLVSAIEPEVAELPLFRTLVYGGSPMPKAILARAVRAFPDAGFVQIFGLTETTGVIAALDSADHKSPDLGDGSCCGRPLDGVELKIVDGNGKDAAPLQTGEILCRSSQVMKGYWKLPAETAHAMSDGWFRTGDVGYQNEQGYFYICDRVKDLIVSGGENIYPAEIENVILNHPYVADAAVIGVPDPRWGESVKALIVTKRGNSQDTASILDHCRNYLAGYKIPKSIDFVESLPRNSSGKVLKRELRKQYWEVMERQVN